MAARLGQEARHIHVGAMHRYCLDGDLPALVWMAENLGLRPAAGVCPPVGRLLGPIHVETGPSNASTGPSPAETGLSLAETGPSPAETGLSLAETDSLANLAFLYEQWGVLEWLTGGRRAPSVP